jgi:eukaryotic-like serine/threonine-protein kinase
VSEEQDFLSEMGLQAGEIVGGYTIAMQIGAGGMGAVLRAKSKEGDVALKVMSPAAQRDPVMRKRFIREARATRAINHPNILKVIDLFEHRGVPIIAMELLSGAPLSTRLHTDRKLSLSDTVFLFSRIVSAVGAAHSLGLVHRDLKPDNVFLSDEAPFVKVLDFGIAKAHVGSGLEGTTALTKTGMAMGTPYYMAPEQAFGEKTLDHRADIWSLGIMLFEALTGKLPTKGNSLHEVLSHVLMANFPRIDSLEREVPEEIATLCARMLSKDPDARPADLREVYATLVKHDSAADSPRSFGPAIAHPLERKRDADVPSIGGTIVMDDPAPAPSTANASSLPSTPLRLVQAVIPTPIRRVVAPTGLVADEEPTHFLARRPDDVRALASERRTLPRRSWTWIAFAVLATALLSLIGFLSAVR